jgi:L-lactate dehydrogenase complex protein LldF
MRLLAWVFASERRYRLAQRLGRLGGRPFVRGGRIRRLPGLGAWTDTRDLRPVARQTFRDWWTSR